MISKFSHSKGKLNANAISSISFCGGYYLGQLLLWISGLKGFPKPTLTQLGNALLLCLIGFGFLKLILNRPKPLVAGFVSVAGLTVLRYLLIAVPELGTNPVVYTFTRNSIELFTFGVMFSVALICEYHVVKRQNCVP